MTTSARSAITFDIDWAPDWCVALCKEICVTAGVPATFFATHPSPELESLRQDPRFEVGVHPNFMTGSSHGATVNEVIDYNVRLVPEATAMRTHGLVQSTEIFRTVIERAPNIQVDVSLFMPSAEHLSPTTLWLGGSRALRRLPYYWEDDIAAMTPSWRWDDPPPPALGLRIFDFHPIHVALNMAAFDQYTAFKTSLGKPFAAATPADAERFRNHGAGARTFLERVVRSLKDDLTRCSALCGAN